MTGIEALQGLIGKLVNTPNLNELKVGDIRPFTDIIEEKLKVLDMFSVVKVDNDYFLRIHIDGTTLSVNISKWLYEELLKKGIKVENDDEKEN